MLGGPQRAVANDVGEVVVYVLLLLSGLLLLLVVVVAVMLSSLRMMSVHILTIMLGRPQRAVANDARRSTY